MQIHVIHVNIRNDRNVGMTYFSSSASYYYSKAFYLLTVSVEG
jgi:hypothetical protein